MPTQRLTGTVKWFDAEKGYGFITPDGQKADERDHFVHISEANRVNLSLKQGDRLGYELKLNDRTNRVSAVNLTAISAGTP